MGVVVKAIILEVVLVQDVLVLAQEVVDLGLTIAFSASSVILSAGAWEESNYDPREEVWPQVDVIDDAMYSLVGQQAFIQALVQKGIVLNNDFVNCLDLL